MGNDYKAKHAERTHYNSGCSVSGMKNREQNKPSENPEQPTKVNKIEVILGAIVLFRYENNLYLIMSKSFQQ